MSGPTLDSMNWEIHKGKYVRNVHKYLWYKIIRNTGAAFGGTPMGLCYRLFCIIDIYGYSLYIPYIFHIYFLAMWNMFSLVCFLIYGVKRKSGHDGRMSFGPFLHVSGLKMVFWRNDIMILHHFCWRSSKIKLFWLKTLIFGPYGPIWALW